MNIVMSIFRVICVEKTSKIQETYFDHVDKHKKGLSFVSHKQYFDKKNHAQGGEFYFGY